MPNPLSVQLFCPRKADGTWGLMGWRRGLSLLWDPHPAPTHPPAPSPGSGLPRVRLQRGELLQPHALPGHGHPLHDHAYL